MNPTSSALAVFEELGVNLEDLDPTTNDLASILDTLSAAGMTTAQAMEVFGARAGPGMLALMSAGGDAVRDMTDAVTGTNKATEMAATQLDTLEGEMKILQSMLEEVALQFGDILIPIIREFLQKYITPLINRFMGLSSGTKKTIVTIALLAAAIGPLLLVIGKLVSGVGAIAKVASLLFTKVGLIIAIIAAVAGVIAYLWNTSEDFRNAVMKIWEKIKSYILKAVEAIKDWWSKNGEKIIASAMSMLKKLWAVVKQIFSKIADLAMKVWPVIKNLIVGVIAFIRQFWDEHGEAIMASFTRVFTTLWNVAKSCFSIIYDAVVKFLSYVGPIWENIKALFLSLWDTLVSLYETLKPIFDLIEGIVLSLYGVVYSVIAGVIQALGPLINAVIDVGQAVMSIIQTVCALLRGDWAEAWECMKDVAINLWDAIKNIFLGIWEFISGFCTSIGSYFSDMGATIVAIFQRAWEGISQFFVNLWDGICSVCSWIWDKLTGLFSSIGDFFGGIISSAFNWGKGLIENIWSGIQAAWDWVVDGVESIGQAIADFLGFGSPTKKGPGHTADEWIPNLMNMMADDLYSDVPLIQRAASQVAGALDATGGVNRGMVGAGSSPYGDLLNGLLQGMATTTPASSEESKEIVMELDGQTFARLIVPKLTREYKRNGIFLKEG